MSAPAAISTTKKNLSWTGPSPSPQLNMRPSEPLPPVPPAPGHISPTPSLPGVDGSQSRPNSSMGRIGSRHSNPLSPPAEPLPTTPGSNPQDQSWLDNIHPRKKDKERSSNLDLHVHTVRGTNVWSNNLEKRSTLRTSKPSKKMSKTATYSGKTATLALRGASFDLLRSPFEDFPELRCKDFPESNLKLDKRQQKERDALISELSKARERLQQDRDAALKMQQKREEKLIKEFQDELNDRASKRMKDFLEKHREAKKERNETMGKPETEKEVQRFEEEVLKSMDQTQTELEDRLIKQRLKWILPWFQSMRASELVQYTQIHSLELVHLEEAQREERKSSSAQAMEDKFEEELKGTIRERKKNHRPMSREEISWEREVFYSTHDEKFQEESRKVTAAQAQTRQKLEKDQQDQIDALLAYYDAMEQVLVGMSK